MRRLLDQYFSPGHTIYFLQKYQTVSGLILEPCSGRGDLAEPLRAAGARVLTNDIDPAMPADSHLDATDPVYWRSVPPPDWVVSNPPFSCCQPIIVGALRVATKGVAMLLRLSYLEPCNNRAEFLQQNPPSLIVLPRISFTGDGKTDNVTCGWFVWDFNRQDHYIRVVSRSDVKNHLTTQDSGTYGAAISYELGDMAG